MDTITTTAPGYARVDIGRLTLFFSEGTVIGYGVKRQVGDVKWSGAAVVGGELATADWGHLLQAEEELNRTGDRRVPRAELDNALTALLEQFDLLGEE